MDRIDLWHSNFTIYMKQNWFLFLWINKLHQYMSLKNDSTATLFQKPKFNLQKSLKSETKVRKRNYSPSICYIILTWKQSMEKLVMLICSLSQIHNPQRLKSFWSEVMLQKWLCLNSLKLQQPVRLGWRSEVKRHDRNYDSNIYHNIFIHHHIKYVNFLIVMLNTCLS